MVMIMKNILIIICLITLITFSGCSSNKNTTSNNVDYNNPESIYSAAQIMYDKKDIYNAIVLFERIPDYKDSQICIDEINCLIELTGTYSVWGDSDIKVYVSPKYMEISGYTDTYYSNYEIVKFNTQYVNSEDLCIYYQNINSSNGAGYVLIKGSEHITLYEVTNYDEEMQVFTLDDFYWLESSK